MRVVRRLGEGKCLGLVFGPPKSAAGKRVVTIPEVIIPVVQSHLACFAEDGDDRLVFTGPEGKPLRHSQRAAMIYLHGSTARQHEIADSLSKIAREELERGSKRPASGKRSGTQRTRNRRRAS